VALVVSRYPERAARQSAPESALVLSDDWNGEWVARLGDPSRSSSGPTPSKRSSTTPAPLPANPDWDEAASDDRPGQEPLPAHYRQLGTHRDRRVPARLATNDRPVASTTRLSATAPMWWGRGATAGRPVLWGLEKRRHTSRVPAMASTVPSTVRRGMGRRAATQTGTTDARNRWREVRPSIDRDQPSR
jgi:hypothetical protein